MIELKCKNCGATLRPDGKCEYCGSVFRFDSLTHVVCVHPADASVLSAHLEIPFDARRYMRPEDISKYSVRELSAQLAEGIAGYMRVDVSEDPCRMATIVRGTVRVIPPDHRF